MVWGPRLAVELPYDVMAALQTVVESDEDDLVVAVMVDWLRSGVAPVSGT
jgi:hypothetical protein